MIIVNPRAYVATKQAAEDTDSHYCYQYYPPIGTAEGTPQYKSLLDAPYMSRDVAEKVEELNNPQPLQPQPRKLRRVTTMVPFKTTTPKRKHSMYTSTRKQPSTKKMIPIASIAE